MRTVVKMPRNGTVSDPTTQEKMEAIGFEFSPLDEIFVAATLPDGWKESNSYWSKSVHLNWLEDQYGRLRVSVYDDENPSVIIHNRYIYIVDAVGRQYRDSDNRPWRGTVFNAIKEIVWRTPLIEAEPCCNSEEVGMSSAWAEWDKQRSDLDTQCIAYLDSHHPDWRDPFAYW